MTTDDRQVYYRQTLPDDQVAEAELTGPDGQYKNTRVISPISATVVRQESPAGPKYQEALGYQFLIKSPLFPSLVREQDGRLVLTLSSSCRPGSSGDQCELDGYILFSDDDGMSWSQPRLIPVYRCTPISLGHGSIMLRGYLPGFTDDDSDKQVLAFSEDAGLTWSEPEPIPPLADGRPCSTDVCLTPLVEGDTVTLMFYVPASGDWSAASIMRPYDVRTREWGEATFLPQAWKTSEGSVVRARNGDLVVALRTGVSKYANMSDHWRCITTTRSADNGKTWAGPSVHVCYGHVHQSLINLPDGRILMTFAARIGELEGRTYHGIEAVLSHDCGATWDWEQRYILFRWSDQSMHSPRSACLADGRILTVLMCNSNYPWTGGDLPDTPAASSLLGIGHVWGVIWSPQA